MNDPMRLDVILGDLFDTIANPEDKEFARHRSDFVFHISDCIDDLERLVDILRMSQKLDEKTKQEFSGLLYHVCPHVYAAATLLLDEVPDAFDAKRKRSQ